LSATNSKRRFDDPHVSCFCGGASLVPSQIARSGGGLHDKGQIDDTRGDIPDALEIVRTAAASRALLQIFDSAVLPPSEPASSVPVDARENRFLCLSSYETAFCTPHRFWRAVCFVGCGRVSNPAVSLSVFALSAQASTFWHCALHQKDCHRRCNI
jgi:hypothetical protein